MRRIERFLLSIFVGIVTFTVLSTSVQAFTFEAKENSVISSDQVISGSLFIAGDNVSVEGIVDGDLFCAGKNVTITGEVRGDVLCAGQNVTIEGVVEGNIRSAGQNIRVGGDTGKNITIAGQTITIDDDAVIAGEIVSFSQNLDMNGAVGKSLLASGENVNINGMVNESVRVQANNLTFGSLSQVKGQTEVVSLNAPQINDGAQVGEVKHEVPTKEDKKISTRRNRNPQSYIGKVLGGTILMWIGGFILVKLFPAFVQKVQSMILSMTGRTALWGAGILFVTPFLVLISFITIIGIPIALTLFLAWIIVLIVSSTFTALAVGKIVLRQLKQEPDSLLRSLLIGAPVVVAVTSLPMIGGIFGFLSALVGSGAFVRAIVRKK